MFPQEFIISFTALMSIGNIKILSSNSKHTPFTNNNTVSVTSKLTHQNTYTCLEVYDFLFERWFNS